MKQGQRVLIVDDLLATGGTAQGDEPISSGGWAATCTRWRFSSSCVALNGRQKLEGERVHAALQY